MDLSELYLFPRSDPHWLKFLPQPYCNFIEAKTIGDLVRLSPSFWRIAARRCIGGTLVVYGDGKHSFGIRLENETWTPDFREAVDGWAPSRNVFQVALLVSQI
jgi:hypothetical protein